VVGAIINAVDSIHYYVDGVLESSGTIPSASLSGVKFPVGYSTVMVAGYFNGVIDTCDFTVFVERACPTNVFDTEGNEYKVTKLAGLCWTENLKSTVYPDSVTPIPFANPYSCDGCPSNLDSIFGLLYTWYSAVDQPEDYIGSLSGVVQGICPEGFHIPAQAEWNSLESYPASQLKSKYYWLNPPASGTDDYGWDARPAGWYNGALDRYEDLYGFAGWWASDVNAGTSTASYFSMYYHCDLIQGEVKRKSDGLSVRCVMD
jgi:uncharacterized protein (TIGR02145 family)